MNCDDFFAQNGGTSAGIINFGGNIRNGGEYLRANGHMQSTLNSTLNGVGNVFFVGWPIQIDTLAWNTTNTSNGAVTTLRFLVNETLLPLIDLTLPSVVQLQTPIQLNVGDKFQVRVFHHSYGRVPGPSQLSLYMSS